MRNAARFLYTHLHIYVGYVFVMELRQLLFLCKLTVTLYTFNDLSIAVSFFSLNTNVYRYILSIYQS